MLRFHQVIEIKLVRMECQTHFIYYTLGSDPALWPARERREEEYIMHDKGYYHSLKDTLGRLARSPKRSTAQAGFSGARVLTAVLPHLSPVSTTMRVDRKRAGDLSLSCPAAHLEEVPGPAKE